MLYLRDSDGVVFPEMAKLPVAAQKQSEIAHEAETQRGQTNNVKIKIGKIDARGAKGMIVNNSGVVNQHYGDTISTGGGDFVKGNKSINTGGGTYIGGNVRVKGDIVGRDKIVNVNTTPVGADAEISGATPEQTTTMLKLYDVLGGFWFSEDDLKDLCFRMSADWGNLSGDTKKAKARAFVHFCFKSARLDELYGLVREARPSLKL